MHGASLQSRVLNEVCVCVCGCVFVYMYAALSRPIVVNGKELNSQYLNNEGFLAQLTVA